MNKILLSFLTIFLIFYLPFSITAQSVQEKNWGIKVGLVVQLGSHSNQIGLKANIYGQYAFTQINLENTSTFSVNNLAGRKKMRENRLALGALLLGGVRDKDTSFVWGGLQHQTAYKNAIGYNYLWYRDNRETSQNSGGWTIQSSGFQLFFENDIFAGTGRDKFRTGNLQLGYQHEEFNFNLGVKLWTGETRGSRWEKVHLDKCPSGFRILEELPYGKTSHGIFYVGADYKLPFTNYASAQLGIDSEQVRHLFQNRLSHDLILFPKSIERKTPHYPRLSPDGCAIFEKNDMRKNKFYAQFGINTVWSY